MNAKSKIFVAGHRGLVGSSIVERLRSLGFTNLILRTRDELDLANQQDVRRFFQDETPEHVFLAAAKVGEFSPIRGIRRTSSPTISRYKPTSSLNLMLPE